MAESAHHVHEKPPAPQKRVREALEWVAQNPFPVVLRWCVLCPLEPANKDFVSFSKFLSFLWYYIFLVSVGCDSNNGLKRESGFVFLTIEARNLET